jgi:hypothetical protein
MRSERKKVAVLASVIVAAVVVASVWPREREPQYKGRRLSEWAVNATSDEFNVAVTETGTNAIPWLIRWLDYDGANPPWTRRVALKAKKFSPAVFARFIKDDDGSPGVRMLRSFLALCRLGPRAGAAIPGLVQLMRQGRPSVACNASGILGYMGEAATQSVLDVMTNRMAYPHLRTECLGNLVQRPLTNGAVLVRPLATWLNEGDPELRCVAAKMLGQLDGEPELAVTALSGVLDDPNPDVQLSAIAALRKFGVKAGTASPSLVGLHLEAGEVRDRASQALDEIAPEVLTNGVSGEHGN